MKDNSTLNIIRGNNSDLDLIQSLWESLNQLHQNLLQKLRKRFEAKTWERF